MSCVTFFVDSIGFLIVVNLYIAHMYHFVSFCLRQLQSIQFSNERYHHTSATTKFDLAVYQSNCGFFVNEGIDSCNFAIIMVSAVAG